MPRLPPAGLAAITRGPKDSAFVCNSIELTKIIVSYDPLVGKGFPVFAPVRYLHV